MTPQVQRDFAERVAQNVTCLDPLTIISILCSVVSLLIKCWQATHATATPAQLSSKLAEVYNSGERQHLLRATARQLRQEARKQGKKLDRDEALELAQKTIEEAIHQPALLTTCMVRTDDWHDDQVAQFAKLYTEDQFDES